MLGFLQCWRAVSSFVVTRYSFVTHSLLIRYSFGTHLALICGDALLVQKQNVLISDSDTAWLRDPRGFFEEGPNEVAD
eukprot:4863234-Pyramimonas_sp.AAC.1